MKKRVGFTLIELIVVILILGILAAVAVPRFINLASQARVAALMGLRAAVISAADLVHAQQLAQGIPDDSSAAKAVNIGGVMIMTYRGYPWRCAGGIDVAVQFDPSTFRFTATCIAPTTFQVIGATDPTHYQIIYPDPPMPGAPPYIAMDTSGC